MEELLASSRLYLKPQGKGCPSMFTFLGCFVNWVFIRERAYIKMPGCFCNHAFICSWPCSSQPFVLLSYTNKQTNSVLIINIFCYVGSAKLVALQVVYLPGQVWPRVTEGEVLPCPLFTAAHLRWGLGGCQGPCGRLPFWNIEPISPIRTICILQSSLARGKTAQSS